MSDTWEDEVKALRTRLEAREAELAEVAEMVKRSLTVCDYAGHDQSLHCIRLATQWQRDVAGDALYRCDEHVGSEDGNVWRSSPDEAFDAKQAPLVRWLLKREEKA